MVREETFSSYSCRVLSFISQLKLWWGFNVYVSPYHYCSIHTMVLICLPKYLHIILCLIGETGIQIKWKKKVGTFKKGFIF